MSGFAERTPLLNSDREEEQVTSVPWVQLILLAFARILDLWYFFGIFPYIGEMLESVGVEEAEIGFYSGLVESAFSASETIFLLCFWTSMSDRMGRRPIMLICLVGISTSAVMYGFSQSAWQMVLSRAMAGVFSGCSGMARIMLGEVTDKTNRAKAFSVSSSLQHIPIFLAPVVGAAAARPCDRYQFFADRKLFRQFPYLLPSLIAGSLGYTIVLANALLLKETKRPGDGPSEEQTSMSTIDLLAYPSVRIVLLATTGFMILEFSWTAMIPVYTYTSVRLGGMGWETSWISYIFLALASTGSLVYLFVIPTFFKLCGVKGSLTAIGYFIVAAFATAPLSNLALRYDHPYLLYIMIPCTGIWAVLTNMFWGTYALAINDASPHPSAFARINMVSQVCCTAVRSIGPPMAGTLYSIGVRYQITQGQFAWTVLAVLGAIWVACMRWYPEDAKGEKEDKPDQRDG